MLCLLQMEISTLVLPRQGRGTAVTVPGSWALRVTHCPAQQLLKATLGQLLCAEFANSEGGRQKGKARLCAHFRE